MVSTIFHYVICGQYALIISFTTQKYKYIKYIQIEFLKFFIRLSPLLDVIDLNFIISTIFINVRRVVTVNLSSNVM